MLRFTLTAYPIDRAPNPVHGVVKLAVPRKSQGRRLQPYHRRLADMLHGDQCEARIISALKQTRKGGQPRDGHSLAALFGRKDSPQGERPNRGNAMPRQIPQRIVGLRAKIPQSKNKRSDAYGRPIVYIHDDAAIGMMQYSGVKMRDSGSSIRPIATCLRVQMICTGLDRFSLLPHGWPTACGESNAENKQMSERPSHRCSPDLRTVAAVPHFAPPRGLRAQVVAHDSGIVDRAGGAVKPEARSGLAVFALIVAAVDLCGFTAVLCSHSSAGGIHVALL